MTSDPRRLFAVVACIATSTVAVPSTTRAQSAALSPSGIGVSLAVGGTLTAVTTDLSGSNRTGTSGAPRVEVSLAATPRLALLAAISSQAVRIDRTAFDLGAVDLGLRYTGRIGARGRPFAELGMARRTFRYGTAPTIESTNLGPSAALGVSWRAAGHWAVEAAGTAGTSTFDQFTADGIGRQLQPVRVRLAGLRLTLRYWLASR